MLADEDVRVGLVVAQQDVVRRAQLLDQGLLKQQRFRFAAGDGDLDIRDAPDQCLGLGIQTGIAEIAGERRAFKRFALPT